MLERLKSLPLTIVLTILIWMYAEAQFTAHREDIPVTLRLAAPSKDYALIVHGADPDDSRGRDALTVRITVQGSQAKIDRLYQQSNGTMTPDEDLANLRFMLPPDDVKAGAARSYDTQIVLNNLPYFRHNGLMVTAASPPRLRVDIELHRPVSPTSTHDTSNP